MMSESIRIRKLTAGDARRLTGFIKRLIDEAKQAWLANIIKPVKAKPQETAELSDGDQEKIASLFAEIVRMICDRYETDVTDWFADLLSITREQYLDLPFDTDIVVIDQIVNAEEFKSFFTKALRVFNVQGKFGKAWSNLSEKYGFTIGSQPSSSTDLNGQNTSSGAACSRSSEQETIESE
jgi:hypothetical protein